MQAKGTEGIGSEYYGSSRDARRVGGGWEGLEEGGRVWKRVEGDGRGQERVGGGMLELGRGEELTQWGPSGQDLPAGSSTLDHDTPSPCWW